MEKLGKSNLQAPCFYRQPASCRGSSRVNNKHLYTLFRIHGDEVDGIKIVMRCIFPTPEDGFLVQLSEIKIC